MNLQALLDVEALAFASLLRLRIQWVPPFLVSRRRAWLNSRMLQGVRIVEASSLAWVARRILRGSQMAMVVGHTVHLSGVTRAQFLSDAAWVAHEMAHVLQFQRYGTVRFLLLYLLESARRGYHHNRFEVQAREAAQTLLAPPVR
ncbi:hypothetical protein GCM10008955_39980 [Deinococcus malanensis]|uniref:DUF4157 domain-containing protein n=1 Tax=Deinococcus malanensis TaxID=1706855 RepID=A0ABQ2F296_9DEIO|nr:DUF4157 domain-containing protein [Deinococcus malanensis]GGK42236.1 hypothetical protein GCM10008955_39980 [Deinococcus malanensis]